MPTLSFRRPRLAMPASTRALVIALAALTLTFASAPSWGADALSATDSADRRSNRAFRGLGFHTHLEIGGVWGQQDVSVTQVDQATLLTGEAMEGEATASGVGLATRLELWPAYGRFAGVGVYGAGHVGAIRRNGAGSGVLGGSTGVLAAAGPYRVRALGMLGRSWRGGAYGEGVTFSKAVSGDLGDVEDLTAGAERVRAYRAGVGLRSAFDRTERAGLDLWMMWDEPTHLRSGDAPIVSLPQRGQSTMLVRSSLWLRNALAVSAEVTVRSNPALGDGSDRTALVSLSWSMDRFSRYGRE